MMKPLLRRSLEDQAGDAAHQLVEGWAALHGED